jgi:hypothetical protein
MVRWANRVPSLVILLLAASFVMAQVEFSGDIVDLRRADAPATKIYFTKDKMRVEPTVAVGHGGGAVIVNFATQTAIVLMMQQHMYMEMPAQGQSQRLGYAFFEADDVENACSYWQKSAHNQGGSCHKMGSESVNGRSTVRFETTSASGEVSHFWLDAKLRFPVKWDGKNNSGELRNIQEGTQPASLFEVPAGFAKMEMPGGMMQMPPH